MENSEAGKRRGGSREGAGRKARIAGKPATRKICVCCNADQEAALKAMAKERGISASRLIFDALGL